MEMSEKEKVQYLSWVLGSFGNASHEARRAARLSIYHETMAVCKRGFYETSGRKVMLPDPTPMMKSSMLYRDPGCVSVPERKIPTIVEVTSEDTFEAGRRLQKEGYWNPAVLNFANRQTPGGGVLKGRGAQEESLFRRSNLFLSLYQFSDQGVALGIPQRLERYPMDRNTGGAYTPNVTVFRGPESAGCPFLPDPYQLSVITVAALNRPPLQHSGRLADCMVPVTLLRMRSIFRIALLHGHDTLVLGAWGCGAFRNPPRHMAELFHLELNSPEFRNRFAKVVFAIHDGPSAGHPFKPSNLEAFRQEFF